MYTKIAKALYFYNYTELYVVPFCIFYQNSQWVLKKKEEGVISRITFFTSFYIDSFDPL